MVTAAEIDAYLEVVRKRPIAYARNVLGLKLWKKQRQILKACADPKIPFISVRSGNGVGKTFLTASIICQYLDSHCPGYAVVSSSSWKQLVKTVWPTLRKVHRQAPVALGGEMQLSEWKRGNEWGAFCASPDEPENFSGFRTENGVLIVVDEASALKKHVHEAIMGVASAAGSKVVYTGNPLRPEGPFYETFSNPDWVNFHIDSREVVDLGIPGLATQEWVDTRRREWGTSSPMYQARVLGEFPESGENQLVPLEWANAAIYKGEEELPRDGDLVMGVDVARYGGDSTFIVIRDNTSLCYMEELQNRSTMEICGSVIHNINMKGVDPSHVSIDDSSMGGGVVDRLRELGYPVVGVNFSERAIQNDIFQNIRAEMYWQVREAVNPESKDHCLYVPQQYKQAILECTWPWYKFSSNGRIQLSNKEDIKKKKGKSPDAGDALALTYAKANLRFAIGVL